jgi:hypothetical protein
VPFLSFAALALLALQPVSSPAGDAAAAARREARLAWERRAAGWAEHGIPDREPVEAAISSWRRALELEPDDLATRFALIEALYFDGHFVERETAAKRARFEEQLALALDTRDRVARPAGGWEILAGLEAAERAARLAGAPGAVEAELWSAISWGVWGMSHSRLAAARRGVAERIREHAELLALLDPAYADGAADRLLGRLHTATPKVPLVTGWLDRDRGIELLRAANDRSTRDGRNPLFLADALLRHRSDARAEALALLREVACRQPSAAALVEESETIEEARRLLADRSTWPALAAGCPARSPAPTEPTGPTEPGR